MERYGKRRVIGTYRNVDTLDRGILRYNERMIAELDLAV
jgi:hypothetical protein